MGKWVLLTVTIPVPSVVLLQMLQPSVNWQINNLHYVILTWGRGRTNFAQNEGFFGLDKSI